MWFQLEDHHSKLTGELLVHGFSNPLAREERIHPTFTPISPNTAQNQIRGMIDAFEI